MEKKHWAKTESQQELSPAASEEKPRGRTSRARYDRPGHLEDGHAERLLRLSGRTKGEPELAFLRENVQEDELANELAEHAVHAMTAGGNSLLDSRDTTVEEEQGGPFLETRASQEFARGGARATAGFFREALPTLGPDPAPQIVAGPIVWPKRRS